MKKIISILLAFVLVAALAACGGAALSGRYVIVEMTDNGNDQIPRLETSGVNSEEIYIAFQSSSAMTMALMTFDGIEEREGTYKVDGDKITFTIDGFSQDAIIDGDTITMNQGSSRMVFEKEVA